MVRIQDARLKIILDVEEKGRTGTSGPRVTAISPTSSSVSGKLMEQSEKLAKLEAWQKAHEAGNRERAKRDDDEEVSWYNKAVVGGGAMPKAARGYRGVMAKAQAAYNAMSVAESEVIDKVYKARATFEGAMELGGEARRALLGSDTKETKEIEALIKGKIDEAIGVLFQGLAYRRASEQAMRDVVDISKASIIAGEPPDPSKLFGLFLGYQKINQMRSALSMKQEQETWNAVSRAIPRAAFGSMSR